MAKVKVKFNARGLLKSVRSSYEKSLDLAGVLVEKEAKRITSKGARGRGSSLRHSRPGEPPKLITGNLRGSISSERGQDRFARPTVRVGPRVSAFYGKFLEFGTSKMAARPFMRRALFNTETKFINFFRNLKFRKPPGV